MEGRCPNAPHGSSKSIGKMVLTVAQYLQRFFLSGRKRCWSDICRRYPFWRASWAKSGWKFQGSCSVVCKWVKAAGVLVRKWEDYPTTRPKDLASSGRCAVRSLLLKESRNLRTTWWRLFFRKRDRMGAERLWWATQDHSIQSLRKKSVRVRNTDGKWRPKTPQPSQVYASISDYMPGLHTSPHWNLATWREYENRWRVKYPLVFPEQWRRSVFPPFWRSCPFGAYAKIEVVEQSMTKIIVRAQIVPGTPILMDVL